MIEAYKHGWPRKAVEAMIRAKIRGGFHSVQVQGLERLRHSLDHEPGGTVFLANHSSWWDVFFAIYWFDAVPFDGYGMMEHFNMLRFGFFRRIGAFSVDRTDPRSVRASIDYASRMLLKPRAAVWIYPQGKIVSNDARPLVFQNGIRALVKRAGRVRVVPVAFRYEFWQDERPEALARFGEPTWVDRGDAASIVPTFEARLTDELDALKADALTQDADRFTAMGAPRPSMHETYARLRARFRGPTPGAPA